MKLPPYDIFPCLEGGMITLRQVRLSDLKDLIDISFYDSVQAKTLQDAEEMLVKINRNYLEGNSVHWGIEDKLTGKIVGTCGFYRGLSIGEAELGAVLLTQYQGKGFMFAAIKLAIEFGKFYVGLNRIFAKTTVKNERAIKLLSRLNFIKVAELGNGEVEYELSNKVVFDS